MKYISSRSLILILLFIIILDGLLFAWYKNLISFEKVMNIVVPPSMVSAQSDVPGVSFSVSNTKLLIQELKDLHIFESGNVILFGESQRVTVKRVVFQLVGTVQTDNKFNGPQGENIISLGQAFDPQDRVLTVKLFLAPSMISADTNAQLSQSADVNIMVYMYQMVGLVTHDPAKFIMNYKIVSGQVLKKGHLFSIKK